MSEPSEFEKAEILETTRHQVQGEHRQMRKCPKCRSRNTTFILQTLVVVEGRLGDKLVYECRRCGSRYEKVFPFPPDYVPGEACDIFKLGAKKDT